MLKVYEMDEQPWIAQFALSCLGPSENGFWRHLHLGSRRNSLWMTLNICFEDKISGKDWAGGLFFPIFLNKLPTKYFFLFAAIGQSFLPAQEVFGKAQEEFGKAQEVFG